MFWKVNECFQFLLNSKRLKYIIPIGLFCVIFGMTFIAFTLSRAPHQIKITVNSNIAGTAQLFWPDSKGRFSEALSSRQNLRPGVNHLKFLLPFGASEKIEKFRFDPNEIKDCKIDIQDISYIYCDKKFYRLPLEKIKSNLYTGISYASISSDKASMVALHNDPQIVIDMKNMVKFRPLLQSKMLKYFVYLLLFSIVAWIILLHCLSKQLNDIYPVLYKVIKITAPVIYVLLSIGIFCFLPVEISHPTKLFLLMFVRWMILSSYLMKSLISASGILTEIQIL